MHDNEPILDHENEDMDSEDSTIPTSDPGELEELDATSPDYWPTVVREYVRRRALLYSSGSPRHRHEPPTKRRRVRCASSRLT